MKSTTRFPMSHRTLPLSPPKGAQKRKTAVFRLKLHFTWRKSAKRFLCVNTVSNKVVRHSMAYLSVQKCISRGTSPTTWKYGRNWPTPFKNADFLSIFNRSDSAVTHSEKSSITRIGIHYELPNEPKMNSVCCP